MKKVALVTSTEFPKLSESDQLLVSPLKRHGVEPTAVAWDDPSVEWSQFDAIILRSAWNYHYRYDPFIKWVTDLEKIRVPVFNAPAVVKWNSQKTYLKDLAQKGIRTIPTVYQTYHSHCDLAREMETHSWNTVVVKPVIGASAYEIFSVSRSDVETGQKKLTKLLEKKGCMLQPLMEEVQQGEYSLIFIGGKYSHAVLKVPPKNDFRSNYQFGSREIIVEPDKTILDQAAHVISQVKSDLLYARVDGIRKDNTFVLMELELIEPHLFFDMYPSGAEFFAAECAKRL